MNYDEIKDSLVIKAINAEENQTLLEEIPHKIVGDMAIIYQIICFGVNEDKESNYEFIEIDNEFMVESGINIETLHNDAVKSSQKILPPYVQTMEEHLGLPFDSVNEKNFIITTEYNINGASSIFYPDVLKKLSLKAGCGLYIIPSSIDECIAFSDTKDVDIENLENVIKIGNQEVVEEGKKLSDFLYHYDEKENLLEKNEDYENRIHLRENNERNMDDYDITDEFE